MHMGHTKYMSLKLHSLGTFGNRMSSKFTTVSSFVCVYRIVMVYHTFQKASGFVVVVCSLLHVLLIVYFAPTMGELSNKQIVDTGHMLFAHCGFQKSDLQIL